MQKAANEWRDLFPVPCAYATMIFCAGKVPETGKAILGPINNLE